MVHSKLGLKVLGLCALVLGLMTFANSAAQAETNSHWNIIKVIKEAEGKTKEELVQVNGTNKLFAQLEIKEIENASAQLLFTTKGGTKVAILCTTAKFDGGGLMQASGGLSLGQVEFTGCITFLNGSLSSVCKPKTTGKPLGTLLTASGTGLIVLSGSEPNVKIIPETGSTLFASIEMGEECSIGTLVKVEISKAGEGLWIKDNGGKTGFEEEKTEHLIEEGSTHGLIALGQPATIDGSAVTRLSVTGEHNGLKWGGTPG